MPRRSTPRVLCAIPARGGSKGVRDKNLQRVGGVSLVGHAVNLARQFATQVPADVRVVVDTDSERIADEACHWGAHVPFLRREELATDSTPAVDTLLALLDRLDDVGDSFDIVVLLQPTSPLRSVEDVVRCWEPVVEGLAPSACAVATLEHPLEHAMELEDASFRWAVEAPPDRRQDARHRFRPSGAAYVTGVARFREVKALLVPGETLPVEIPLERSVDIDRPADLEVADAMLARRRASDIAVGGRSIGRAHPCFVIAEAGVNHNGDLDLARQLVDVAADAGADAVKFQLFDPSTLATADAPKASYQQHTTDEDESQLDMLRRLSLSLDAFGELRALAHERGIEFLATPFDASSADFLASLGLPALKVASGELTNHALLTAMAVHKVPLLISTGMATMAEVAAALEVVEQAGSPPVALLHCVSAYPAAAEDCNLEAIRSMRATFGVPVGWSDHTSGLSVSLAARALGADIIEKHVTLDRNLPGPDHAASLEPDELAQLIREIRRVGRSLGDGRKQPTPSEADTARVARRSLHLARDIQAGERIRPDDLVALRPGTGLPPSRLISVAGRAARTNLRAGRLLLETDLR